MPPITSPAITDTTWYLDRLNRQLSYLTADEAAILLSDVRSRLRADLEETRKYLADLHASLEEISRIPDTAALAAIHQRLNTIEMERFLRHQSVTNLHRSCTEYRDRLADRARQLVEQELAEQGKPTLLPYALISMGSDGREEQTLITDQDYLIVYEDDGGEAADRHFEELSNLLVERLAETGFAKCTGNIMPSNPTWRGSYSQWKRRLMAIMRYEYEDYAKNLMDLIVMSDARFVAGNEELATRLIGTIRGLEQDYFQVLWGMAKAASEMKIGLGFMKRLWTDSSGEHKGEMNLKLLGWAPLVMNVRILAINQAIPGTNTLQRIDLLQKEGSFSKTMAEGLRQAYHTLTRHRVLLQVKKIKGIQKDSYYLNPYELGNDEREELRQALLKIEDLQKVIHVNFSVV